MVTQAQVFLLELFALQGAVHGDQQLAHGNRFFDIVIGAQAGCLNRSFDGAMS